MTHRRKHFYDDTNRSTRIDVFDELTAQTLSALRQFARRLGAPHLVDEVFLPTLAEGDCQLIAGVRDRPWPPWGLGAREIVALCMTHSIADASYAVSPVYALTQDLNNVGLLSSVYKEALEQLAAVPNAEICYLAAEHSTLADHVLRRAGMQRTPDVFVTWLERYYTYRAPVRRVLEALGLEQPSTPELLAHAGDPQALQDQATFHQTIYNGSLPEWIGTEILRSEIIGLVRGGHAGKPGGVPGGSGRWEWAVDPEINFAVSINNLLADRRTGLLQYVLESESKFRNATVTAAGQAHAGVDERLRRAKTLDDLGPYRDVFEQALLAHLEPAMKRLNRPGFPMGRVEMQITASGNGDYFRLHADSDAKSTREISFVYYFHREPRRFSGGELRLYDCRQIDGRRVPSDTPQTLSPRQDLLLLFPSANDHEVLPVRVPSGEFADSRFTINGWIHRAS
ncbi:MAG: 2OG-Fe(II) oxygenase [Proteobacteria bacterium]|nr:2OG-Fe(II) oxygenase [Pseudomonadota bacterium]